MMCLDRPHQGIDVRWKVSVLPTGAAVLETKNEMFRLARDELDRLGIPASHNKIWRSVHGYRHVREEISFLEYLRITYQDRTGEVATDHVQQEAARRFPKKRSPLMDLLTTDEAAEFLHLSLATLRHYIATSQAPRSAKIGRRRMFRKSDCEAWGQAKFDAA